MQHDKYLVEMLALSDINDKIELQWQHLDSRCLDPNPFIKSKFILPMIGRVLNPDGVKLLLVWTSGEHRILVGIIILASRGRSLEFCFRHHVYMSTVYAPLSSIALDKDHAANALLAIAARAKELGIKAIYMDTLSLNSPLITLFADCVDKGVSWLQADSRERAYLNVRSTTDQQQTIIKGKKLREIKRRTRKLSEQGELEWRCVNYSDIDEQTIESFLKLEHKGWKGESGSSLLSDAGASEFFKNMVKNFAADGEAFFSELWLDGNLIASQLNLEVSGIGYIYKNAYDQEYAKYSPGIINQYEQMNYIDDDRVRAFDSCTTPDSFLEDLWTDKMGAVSGYLIFSPLMRRYTSLMLQFKSVIRRYRQ